MFKGVKEKLKNINKKDINFYSRNCNFEILLEIIYLKIKCKYSNGYDENNEFMDKITSSSMLIEIPSENLYFYIYDERCGIIVSGNNDKIKFKNIISKIDNELLNTYWFKDIIMKIFNYTEKDYKKIYESIKIF